MMEEQQEKSQQARREEEILEFWRANDIFQKSLDKESPKGNFVFYDGPPFATGLPHYGHMLPSTIKDVIPRFKTMQGYHVPRRWGWDCHGLPVENLIEKELNLKSKKDIVSYGIEKFNGAARTSVLRYDADWKKIIPRSGRWIDMDHAYLTMDWKYSESIWWSFKTLHNKNLIYQGFKVMQLCPHCETTLSNFEVTQGYKDITDISVYVKFELVDEPGTFLVAWTTTPWTLPGNVALAISSDSVYSIIQAPDAKYIVAADRAADISAAFLNLESTTERVKESVKVIGQIRGKELVGKGYKPVFDYYANTQGETLKNKQNGWKVYAADFVTTDDGTGIVHIAPAFGEDDYQLSLKEQLPFVQHVAFDGTFKKDVSDFAGMSVKPKDDHQRADIEIIKYLAHNNSLLGKKKIIHPYPHCWRCDTPLLNYAASSWFVEVTTIKHKLLAENKKVNWLPQEIGDGRFGKWLEGARDWAISRSRFWGAPLPVWICDECHKTEVVGSVAEITKHTKRNNYFLMRHGESEHNITNTLSSDPRHNAGLTDTGRAVVGASAVLLKDKKIDLIITSPYVRTKETAEIIAEHIGFTAPIITDQRLSEFNFGEFEGKNVEEYHRYFSSVGEKIVKRLPGGENILDVRDRVGAFLYDIDQTYKGKTILIITHDSPATLIASVAEGGDRQHIIDLWSYDADFINPGEVIPLEFAALPHNREYELDLHRPYIDDIIFTCSCGGDMKRIPEVFDTWYESGSMPFGQIHYPFEHKNLIDEKINFPADFIAEGQDQTRGWFYSLLVLSTGLFLESPYKNVVANGIILAEDGQKMSKKLKNYPEINLVFNKYGADALRYFLLASPAVHAEDLLFSEKSLDEVVKKLIMRLQNVYTFYDTYRTTSSGFVLDSDGIFLDKQKVTTTITTTDNVLDQWIIARLQELALNVTENLERYQLDRAAKLFMNFVDDLSTWYLRRSRDRFKGDSAADAEAALATTGYVLREVSKLLAPFMPFLAEDIYQKVKQQHTEQTEESKESVHLEQWPHYSTVYSTLQDSSKILKDMAEVRALVSQALEARAAAKIKVRQPLTELVISHKNIIDVPELVELIKDEVNVKKVTLGTTLLLNIEITPELKQEGQAREFIRSLQELRKKAKLNPAEKITLTISTDSAGKALIEKFKSEIVKTAQVHNVLYEDSEEEILKNTTEHTSQHFIIDEFNFRVTIGN